VDRTARREAATTAPTQRRLSRNIKRRFHCESSRAVNASPAQNTVLHCSPVSSTSSGERHTWERGKSVVNIRNS
jgi:hypothetical protein